MVDLEINNWNWDHDSKLQIQKRVNLCNQILSHLGNTNTNFRELSDFIKETFLNSTYIDYNKILFVSKPP
jgi:hypothetical protein